MQPHQSSPSSRTSSGSARQVTPDSGRDPRPWEEEVGPDGLTGLSPGLSAKHPWDWTAQPHLPARWQEVAQEFRRGRWERLDWLEDVPGLGLSAGESAWIVTVPTPTGEPRPLLVVAQVPPCPGDQVVLSQVAEPDIPVLTVAVMWPAVGVPAQEYAAIAHGAQYWQEGPFLVMAGKQVLQAFVVNQAGPGGTSSSSTVPPPPPLDMR